MTQPDATPSAPRGPQDPDITAAKNPVAAIQSPRPASACSSPRRSAARCSSRSTPGSRRRSATSPSSTSTFLSTCRSCRSCSGRHPLAAQAAGADGRDRQRRGGDGMSNVNAIMFTIVLVLFLIVTGVGFARRPLAPPAGHGAPDEWGLAGRGFGMFITWFLLGGDLYTAYTFIAVPALVFGSGSIGFFAVSYTILVYPIASSSCPGCGRSPGCTATSRQATSSGAATARAASRWPWPSPASWPSCRTSRCSSSASRRC